MKTQHSVLVCVATLMLLACASSDPPKPPVADGEIVAANDQKSLEELVRAAVAAANPKAQRFNAARGESLKDVLIRWTQQERIRLFYQTTFNPVLTGGISEPDIRAAGVSLSILLQYEDKGALLDFTKPGSLIVRDTPTSKD
jgi:hypothetical protein